jgi:plastocyanin
MSNAFPRATLVALTLLGCGGSTPSGPGAGEHEILATASLQFSPADKSVAAGTAVTWKFAAVAHTVHFDDVSGRPTNIANAVANQSVSRTFGQVGVFPYQCTIHPGMEGIVRVVPPGSVVPPPPPPPPPGPYY